MEKSLVARYVVFCEAIGFAIVLSLLWLNEVIDLPHVLFGVASTPVNWVESLFESAVVVLLATLVMASTSKSFRRIRHLEGFLQICAACKRVRYDDAWIPFDVFLRDHSDAAISHGLCPRCAEEFSRSTIA